MNKLEYWMILSKVGFVILALIFFGVLSARISTLEKRIEKLETLEIFEVR